MLVHAQRGLVLRVCSRWLLRVEKLFLRAIEMYDSYVRIIGDESKT